MNRKDLAITHTWEGWFGTKNHKVTVKVVHRPTGAVAVTESLHPFESRQCITKRAVEALGLPK